MHCYKNIFEEFKKRNCELLTTEEELIEIRKLKNKSLKFSYIASCGHKHIVFYSVFKSRNTGVICPSCKNKNIGMIKKEKIKNNELSKIYTIEQEFLYIQQIISLISCDFEIKKAFDGCLVDLIYKPKNTHEDRWVGIQIKTTKNIHLTYSFHIESNYENCLLLCYCFEDNSSWLFPENIIKKQQKLSIGYKKSKYNDYKIKKEDISNKLNELYITTTKFNFSVLNKPLNIYQQREQDFRVFRENKIDFICFNYPEMEATVYDFMIGNLKIQEKVTQKNKAIYYFNLCKNNGILKKQYDIGDNDIYWLNCSDKTYFFVIPEKLLIEKGFIGNINKKTIIKINPISKNIYKLWYNKFMFHYENIDKDRLIKIINQHD